MRIMLFRDRTLADNKCLSSGIWVLSENLNRISHLISFFPFKLFWQRLNRNSVMSMCFAERNFLDEQMGY